MNPSGYALVFLVSAAVLAYQILLIGLFALIQWHHFASMIISVALLGFGVSGTVLAIGRPWFVERWEAAWRGTALVFLLALLAVTAVLPHVRFNPFQLLWDARQLWHLLAYYLLLLLPFTAGATVIGLAFLKPGVSIPRVYCFNLLGSGAGVFGGLALGFVALDAPLSEYKSLSKCLLLPEARIIQREGHPLGRMDIVTAPALRVAPGLSLAYRGPMPRQEAIFVNGDGPSALMLDGPGDAALDLVDWLPNALPYHLLERPKVLVIGAGGGLDLLQAIRLDARSVLGIEAHPCVARYVGSRLAAPVEICVAEGRGFVRATSERFDLIQISLLESFGAASAGVYSLQENYLYTVEAFGDYLARLNDGGLLVITRWLKTPPRDEIRLFATAVRSLEAAGVRQAGGQLMFLRGLQAGTLLVKRTPFTEEELERARRFCDERSFDLDWFPGILPSEANRFHKVPGNTYHLAFEEILRGDRNDFYRRYAFDVRPRTDDRPFFSQFFHWAHAGQLWALLRQQALPVVEWGYLVALATLAQTVLISVLLIGLPLVVARRFTFHVSRFTTLLYFAALGLGFMLLEMALLQKFVLFLAHPIYSAAVVIAAFLVFAGLGSAVAWMRSPFAPLCAVIVVGAVEMVFLPRMFGALLALPLVWKAIVVVAMIAPLAFFMGMPFPLALRRLALNAPPLLPWAWGVNGCLSVVAASLAPLLAVHFGFGAVIALGLGCYFVAAVVCDRGAQFAS